MKKKILFSALLISFLLVGCGKKTESTPTSSSEEIIPDYTEDPDGYIDVLPEKTSQGNILHCFNWSFNQIKDNLQAIKDAGFRSVQTSPVQQPKSNGSAWWAFYQPLSFSIAENSPLGTKDELEDMCDKAEELGISVIVDVVFNHLANITDGEYEADGTPKVCPDVQLYEPEIYSHRNDSTNPTFHHTKTGGETQSYPYGDLPDLNTANELVQERSYALLKECIDVGVDGFRFDAAKHIETKKDGAVASSFWDNTLVKAQQYYTNKTGNELYAYGEILGTLSSGRDVTGYSDIMDITDDGTGGAVSNAIRASNAVNLAKVNFGKMGVSPTQLVSWVESHDTYTSTSSPLSNKRIVKGWAAVASRKENRALFFARPSDDLAVANIGSYEFENEVIASVNRFKNRFIGSDEERSSENESTYIIQRFNDKSQGALLVELSDEKEISVTGLNKLTNGIYYDQITGKKVTVHNGKATIEIDASGVSILTKTADSLRPTITVSQRSCGFANSMDLTITTNNATNASYSINGGAAVSFTGKKTITLTETSKLDITASNTKFTINRSYDYKKYELIPGYFNVVGINPSTFTDFDVYLWSWGGKYGDGKWNQDYTVQDGVLLTDVTGITGFLVAVFPKGYAIKDVTKWDSGVVRQSGDIKGTTLTQGFYDATGI